MEHAEEGVAVVLELGALVRVHGILDRELVQSEVPRDLRELLVGRPVEADPGDPGAVPAGLRHAGEIGSSRDP
jgi:hypothetical protein